MNKSESKYFNTAVKMDEAFLRLLERKEFEYITVKEICKEAGVHRSTFYLHYETLNDLLDETMGYINEKFSSYFKNESMGIEKIQSLPLKELYLITPRYLLPWLTFTKENKKLFQTFLKRRDTLKVVQAYKEMFGGIIKPILTRYGVKSEDQEYTFLFYVEGIVGIIKKWIREGCTRDTEEIMQLIMGCVKSYEG